MAKAFLCLLLLVFGHSICTKETTPMVGTMASFGDFIFSTHSRRWKPRNVVKSVAKAVGSTTKKGLSEASKGAQSAKTATVKGLKQTGKAVEVAGKQTLDATETAIEQTSKAVEVAGKQTIKATETAIKQAYELQNEISKGELKRQLAILKATPPALITQQIAKGIKEGKLPKLKNIGADIRSAYVEWLKAKIAEEVGTAAATATFVATGNPVLAAGAGKISTELAYKGLDKVHEKTTKH